MIPPYTARQTWIRNNPGPDRERCIRRAASARLQRATTRHRAQPCQATPRQPECSHTHSAHSTVHTCLRNHRLRGARGQPARGRCASTAASHWDTSIGHPCRGKSGRPEASSPPGPKAHGAPRRRTPSAGLPVSHGGGGGSATRGGAVSSCVSSIGGRVSLREFLLRRAGTVRRRSGGRLRRGFGRGAGLSHRREFRRSSAG